MGRWAGARRRAESTAPEAQRSTEPRGATLRPRGMRPDTRRARTGARYFLIAAVCAAAATACGTTQAPTAAAAKPATPKVSLDIKVSGSNITTKHWTLQCDPAGGTHPDAAAACTTLLKAKTPFAPVPKGVMCPMIMAGTKTAIV